jgi:MscS family membrane protein
VEEVGFRSTRIRTFTNSVIYVPNGKLADATINNHGLRKFRRYHTKLSITYDTPPQLIEVFVEGLRKIVREHPNINQDMVRVYLNDFSDSAILILINVFFDVPDANTELENRQQFMLEIIKLAEKLNVRFAFPTQTLHIENFPGKPTLTPSYDLKDRIFKKDDTEKASS